MTLAGIEPSWTLTGGAALVGFHTKHRTTRDLDLFWHGHQSITEVRRDVTERLRGAGWTVSELRTTESFAALRVEDRDAVVIVDLVAEPVRSIESPAWTEIGGRRILVDTPHEILTNKLCALLHRSELRDLLDIEALLSAGGDLDRALNDAPNKDGGFSSLTLGWTLESWNVVPAANAAGLEDRAEGLDMFRQELLRRIAGGGLADGARE